MGSHDSGPSGDGKIVYLFAEAGKNTPPASASPALPVFPFYELSMVMQQAWYYQTLYTMSLFTRMMTSGHYQAHPKLVADKDWLDEMTGYAPFVKKLSAEGHHLFASYNAAVGENAPDGVVRAGTVEFSMNVSPNGQYIEVFHGDRAAGQGHLLTLEWSNKADAYVVEFFNVEKGKPHKVENPKEQVLAFLAALVPAINHQNRQIYERIHASPMGQRSTGNHLHLVS